jgi:hypothetical protein
MQLDEPTDFFLEGLLACAAQQGASALHSAHYTPQASRATKILCAGTILRSQVFS